MKPLFYILTIILSSVFFVSQTRNNYDELPVAQTASLHNGESTQTSMNNQQIQYMQQVNAQIIDNLVNNMVKVAGGTFMMGATDKDGYDALNNEKPSHKVKLSSFSIGRYEVTQEEWDAVMGSNNSRFKGSKLPVHGVNWGDSWKFIKKLNELTGKNFRLPTEAEWEFAARGGNSSKHFKYAGSDDLSSVAWFSDNSGEQPHIVGTKQPNELGLYDMSGNVSEWCNDWLGDYSSSSQKNPTGPAGYLLSSGSRVYRGGSWNGIRRDCRVANRHSIEGLEYYFVGFRLAL